MRSYALILAAAWISSVSSTDNAQVTQKITDVEVITKTEITQEQFDEFKDKLKTLYFAANCGVLSGLAGGE